MLKMYTIHSSFVISFHDSLEKSYCEHMMQKFSNDPRKREGTTLGGVNKKMKDTCDLKIDYFTDWSSYVDILRRKLQSALDKYLTIIPQEFELDRLVHGVADNGFQIQQYLSNVGHYDWHHDFVTNSNGQFRLLTFIWYLNDVAEGGETEFKIPDNNTIVHFKIQPRQGTLLLFPSNWHMRHRGCIPVSNDKFIITGWLYAQ
jgi:hypothetical protein